MNPEISTALISLAGVVTGALISPITSFVLEGLSRKHQRRVLLREKYEELWDQYILSRKHIGDLIAKKNLEEYQAAAQNLPANNCYKLCQIYFPMLRNVSLQYLNSAQELYSSLAPSIVTASYGVNPEIPEGLKPYEEAKRNYLFVSGAFEASMKAFSTTYASS